MKSSNFEYPLCKQCGSEADMILVNRPIAGGNKITIMIYCDKCRIHEYFDRKVIPEPEFTKEKKNAKVR